MSPAFGWPGAMAGLSGLLYPAGGGNRGLLYYKKTHYTTDPVICPLIAWRMARTGVCLKKIEPLRLKWAFGP